MKRYDIAKEFTLGFTSAIGLTRGMCPGDSPHYTAGYEAGYPFRKVKGEKLNEYLVSIGVEPMATIKLAEAKEDAK